MQQNYETYRDLGRKPEGYDYIQNDSGDLLAVGRATGEVLPAVTLTAPVGSIIYTPEDQKNHKEWKEHLQQRRKRRAQSSALGRNFYFLNRNVSFDGLSPATAARLVYLATYTSHYDNRLQRSERRLMQRKDLPSVLGVSPATADRFWKEVSPRYVMESDDGLLFTAKEAFVRGGISSESYHRVWVDGVRQVYRKTDIKHHGHLGYIFQLLPYVNIEYNCLCHNIMETDSRELDFMTVAELCELIGYDQANFHRLKKVYRSIEFDVGGGRMERFCNFVYDGLDQSKAKIYINPHVVYSGTNYKQVEILGAFCND